MMAVPTIMSIGCSWPLGISSHDDPLDRFVEEYGWPGQTGFK